MLQIFKTPGKITENSEKGSQKIRLKKMKSVSTLSNQQSLVKDNSSALVVIPSAKIPPAAPKKKKKIVLDKKKRIHKIKLEDNKDDLEKTKHHLE